MPFVQRTVEPKYLARSTNNNLFNEDGSPRITDEELQAVANNTLCNALKQLASLVLIANDIFEELGKQLKNVNKRSEDVKLKIRAVEERVLKYDPKKVTVPEGDICSFALLRQHYASKHITDTNLFSPDTRPEALRALYNSAAKTPVFLMRQLDRWRRDGCRSSRMFMCTPVLGAKRRRIRNRVDIDIETSVPAAVGELRRWTSEEAIGDMTVAPNCASRITSALSDGELTDDTLASEDEGVDHKLPSPEEQLQVVALRFPAEIVAVDISGKSFDRMSSQRRSLLSGELLLTKTTTEGDSSTVKRRTRSRRPRNRRRNTLAGTDQKEIRDALTAGEEQPSSSTVPFSGTEPSSTLSRTTSKFTAAIRSKSSDLLRSSSKKESPDAKKPSHFNTLKQWGKSRYDRFMNKSAPAETTTTTTKSNEDIDDFNVYETITMKRKKDLEKERKTHERNSSISSSEKSSINIPLTTTNNTLSSVMNIAVKLRDSSMQRRLRRTGNNKEEPHSSSGNWSASSESGRASIGSEITTTTHPKSTTSAATSSNSINQQPPSSVNSRRRFNFNTSASSSVTSEGTLTPDIIHDLNEDGENSSVYSCDTEGYYTSFHMDSGLKTLKEEELPSTPLHSTTVFTSSGSNTTVLSAENEYELFGKGSTSTTTSSAGTVCTTLRAAESNRSLVIGPAVPERKSSLSKLSNASKSSPESSLERNNDKFSTVKRSPNNIHKPTVVALIQKPNDGDVSPDSGHNTSSSPIESISSPNGVRSGSEFEYSESSDMEGPERIERIRVKTTINSSRIPSMCVITPPHSDDESSSNSSSKSKNHQSDKNADTRIITTNLNGTQKMSLMRVNAQSGYATVEPIMSIDQPDGTVIENKTIRAPSPSGGTMTVNNNNKTVRAASPSGGSVIVKEEGSTMSNKPSQPTIKASLMPLNNMFGKLKNFARRDRSKSPNTKDKHTEELFDAGEYVTIADVRNNNEKSVLNTEELTYANDVINKNLNTILSGKIRDTEYVSLNDLPTNENNNIPNTSADSLERKRRQGARVTLDAEGKVLYSSDSLRKRKGSHTTFEPGPFVKAVEVESPLPTHRTPVNVRPVTNTQEQMLLSVPQTEFNRPMSPQFGKVVIKASSGTTEVVRMPPATIVSPTSTTPSRPMSPKIRGGAYVHIQDTDGSTNTAQEKELIHSQGHQNHPVYYQKPTTLGTPNQPDMYNYHQYHQNQVMEPLSYQNQYYLPPGSNPGMYSTLPSKRTHYFSDIQPERSVTPDITRGLERNYENYGQNSLPRSTFRGYDPNLLNQKLGIPVQMPNLPYRNAYDDARTHEDHLRTLENINESLRISPIDPRNSVSFKSSTPSGDMKAATNLESKLLSPKKSTMSNDELYAVIHKSKKKLNIEDEYTKTHTTPVIEPQTSKQSVKSPETGYIGDNKSRSRLSWSPNKGDYVDFNSDIDKISPTNNDSRSRQSWACSDRKPTKKTSQLDFKKLLLQKSSNILSGNSKKLSAVEQLKLSKNQITQSSTTNKNTNPQKDMTILDLSASPRSLVNRKLGYNNPAPGSPSRVTPEKPRTVPKILSPKSQWRFASPRSDVLSSTILEDCREDESPNSSGEKRTPSNTSPSFSDNFLNRPGMPTFKSEHAEVVPHGTPLPENIINRPAISTFKSDVSDSFLIRPRSNLTSDAPPSGSTANRPRVVMENSPRVYDNYAREPRNMSVAQRLSHERAKFFNLSNNTAKNTEYNKSSEDVPPALETAF